MSPTVFPKLRSIGAEQQFHMLSHHLAEGGWRQAMARSGPTPEHVPLLSAMWVIGYTRTGVLHEITFNDHKVRFRYETARGMRVEVDGFMTSFKPDNMRTMLT